jgi:hypothetical protein
VVQVAVAVKVHLLVTVKAVALVTKVDITQQKALTVAVEVFKLLMAVAVEVQRREAVKTLVALMTLWLMTVEAEHIPQLVVPQ